MKKTKTFKMMSMIIIMLALTAPQLKAKTYKKLFEVKEKNVTLNVKDFVPSPEYNRVVVTKGVPFKIEFPSTDFSKEEGPDIDKIKEVATISKVGSFKFKYKDGTVDTEVHIDVNYKGELEFDDPLVGHFLNVTASNKNNKITAHGTFKDILWCVHKGSTTDTLFNQDQDQVTYGELLEKAKEKVTSTKNEYTILVIFNDGTTNKVDGKQAGISSTDFVLAEVGTSSQVAVESVELSANEELSVNEKKKLTPIIHPNNAINRSVTWKSSNENIVTVSESGEVTGLAEGTAIITVNTTDGNKQATCEITVTETGLDATPVTSVTVSPTAITFNGNGQMRTLTATIYPANATDKSVTWSSSNEEVAIVEIIPGYVLARPVSEGTATITATTNDGGKTATCEITVEQIEPFTPVTSVSVSPTTEELDVNGTLQLTATVYPGDATSTTVTWSSNNPSVATVSNTGVVTAKAVGTATITVTTINGGFTATCVITVTETGVVAVTSVTVSPPAKGLNIGETDQLTATVFPSGATDKTVTWRSSNPSVATVTNMGRVTAKAEGTTDITVKSTNGGFTATCVITVNEQGGSTGAVTSVSVAPTTKTLSVNETQQLTANVSPDNANDKSVTWSSSDPSIATVSTDGLVTAKAVGTTTITVTTTDGNKTATCAITVKEQGGSTVSVTSVSVAPTTKTLNVNETQQLTATVLPANANNKSVTWSSNNSSIATVSTNGLVTAKAAGTATITVTTADGNKTATATITVKTSSTPIIPPVLKTFTVALSDSEGGTVDGAGNFEEGEKVTVTATANEGYSFKGWEEEGIIVSTFASFTFNLTSDRFLDALFEADPVTYRVTLSSDPTPGGTTSGEGTFEEGEEVTVTAIAKKGYLFKHWEEWTHPIWTMTEYRFVVNENRTLTAVFEKEKPTSAETIEAGNTLLVYRNIIEVKSDGAYELTLFNITGQLMMQVKGQGDATFATDVPPGVYIARLVKEGKQILSKRIHLK